MVVFPPELSNFTNAASNRSLSSFVRLAGPFVRPPPLRAFCVYFDIYVRFPISHDNHFAIMMADYNDNVNILSLILAIRFSSAFS